MELMYHRDQKGDISRVMRQTTDSDLIIELSLLLLRRIGKLETLPSSFYPLHLPNSLITNGAP